MKLKQKINSDEFLKNFNSKIRELIDEITGIIFQNFDNVNEKIINEKFKYSNSKSGNFCTIEIKDEIVILNFKNKNKIKIKNKLEIKKNKENILKNLSNLNK